MSDDIELEYSPLCGSITSAGKTVEVQIYRGVGDPCWFLEIEDEHGNSTVWDGTFETDTQAITEAKKAILEETVSSFIGPEDGKSTDGWR